MPLDQIVEPASGSTTYAGMTETEKKNLALYDQFLRGLFSGFAKISKQVDPESWNAFAIANIDAAVALLGNGEVIPNSTNLAGAVPLTKIEFLTLQGIARTLRTTQINNLPLLIKAVGINQ